MIKIKSKNKVAAERISFVILSPLSTSIAPLAKEKVPPTRSRIILKIFHPFVLFLL
jgi:hypothetical protein